MLSLVLSPERAGECLDYAIAEKSKTDLERDFIAELRGLAAWLETESYYLEPSLKYPSQAAAQLIQATVPKN
ncbi:MAG TPA: hypothetical protein VMJ32_12870 [Pirellulales bacterium]|nr:hypothetical protein [Pirellulales bacterium]